MVGKLQAFELGQGGWLVFVELFFGMIASPCYDNDTLRPRSNEHRLVPFYRGSDAYYLVVVQSRVQTE